MTLLLQLNAELPEKFPGHDRRLYVFSCRKAACQRKKGSIRAIRGVRVWKDVKPAEQEEKTAKEEKPKGLDLGSALFGKPGGAGNTNANPFSQNNNPFGHSSPPGNPFQAQKPSSNPLPTATSSGSTDLKEAQTSTLARSFAETVSLNTPPLNTVLLAKEAWPDADSLPKPYPISYLCEADYETLDPTNDKIPSNVRVEEADASEPSALDREAFESAMDATFQKFADRLSQNPEQIIRYEFAGTPLLYSKTDAIGVQLTKSTMPGCPNCGGRRTFEVQLTPNAIAELEADEMTLEGMEWGTIILGVCEGDCSPRQIKLGEAGYLEEWVGVQWEEVTSKK